MDLALNNLQRLTCHKIQQNKPNQTKWSKIFTWAARTSKVWKCVAGLKMMDSETMLKTTVANLVSSSLRGSCELKIFQFSILGLLHNLLERLNCASH